MNIKLSVVTARRTAVVCLLFLVAACQTTTAAFQSDTLKRDDAALKVLVMPLDVELSELNAGGTQTVRADWSEDAKGFMQAELDLFLKERNASTVTYIPLTNDPDPRSNDVQILKLFEAVGGSIARHRYAPAFQLPNKGENFDWTLGPTVKEIGNAYDADYGLFILVRDSYATAGRAAAMVFAAALGVGIPGGIQVGYAALVDMRTGDISWFNLLARGHGDLRTAPSAKETMGALLVDFPK